MAKRERDAAAAAADLPDAKRQEREARQWHVFVQVSVTGDHDDDDLFLFDLASTPDAPAIVAAVHAMIKKYNEDITLLLTALARNTEPQELVDMLWSDTLTDFFKRAFTSDMRARLALLPREDESKDDDDVDDAEEALQRRLEALASTFKDVTQFGHWEHKRGDDADAFFSFPCVQLTRYYVLF